MKLCTTKFGYKIVELKLDVREKILVHRAVLEAFLPVDCMNELQVNHKDGNKSNNVLSNLEWTTRSENMQHAMKMGLFHPEKRCGEKHPMCKLSDNQIEEIKEKLTHYKRGLQHKLALEYNVSDCTISEIKTKRHRFAE